MGKLTKKLNVNHGSLFFFLLLDSKGNILIIKNLICLVTNILHIFWKEESAYSCTGG